MIFEFQEPCLCPITNGRYFFFPAFPQLLTMTHRCEATIVQNSDLVVLRAKFIAERGIYPPHGNSFPSKIDQAAIIMTNFFIEKMANL